MANAYAMLVVEVVPVLIVLISSGVIRKQSAHVGVIIIIIIALCKSATLVKGSCLVIIMRII